MVNIAGMVGWSYPYLIQNFKNSKRFKLSKYKKRPNLNQKDFLGSTIMRYQQKPLVKSGWHDISTLEHLKKKLLD